jgi:uncharacterized RDD family membrane protein YckC
MSEFAHARFWRRFMSMTYEGIILFGVVFFFTYGYSALTRFQGHPGTKSLIYQVYMCGILGLYFVYFWSSGRRTLPMKTVEIMLHDTHGQPISVSRALARYLAMVAMILAALALGQAAGWGWITLALVPVLWALIDRQGRTLYDIASGTHLVIVPVPRRAPKSTAA